MADPVEPRPPEAPELQAEDDYLRDDSSRDTEVQSPTQTNHGQLPAKCSDYVV